MVLLRRLLLGALLVGAMVAGAKFSDENEMPVAIGYVFGTLGEVPLWVALVGSFGLGAGLCLLAVVGRLTRSTLAQRRYRKTVAALESEVHQLRNLPIEGVSAAEAIPLAGAPPAVVEAVAGGADGAERGA